MDKAQKQLHKKLLLLQKESEAADKENLDLKERLEKVEEKVKP